MAGEASEECTQSFRRGSGDGTYSRKAAATREAPSRGLEREGQPETREGPTGRGGVTERFVVVPWKPVKAGGGKGPQFETGVGSSEGREIGKPSNSG
jgi:hypothetical protein